MPFYFWKLLITTFPLVLIYSTVQMKAWNINLIYLLIKWELDFIFGKQMSLLLKLKHGRNSVLCYYSQQKL